VHRRAAHGVAVAALEARGLLLPVEELPGLGRDLVTQPVHLVLDRQEVLVAAADPGPEAVVEGLERLALLLQPLVLAREPGVRVPPRLAPAAQLLGLEPEVLGGAPEPLGLAGQPAHALGQRRPPPGRPRATPSPRRGRARPRPARRRRRPAPAPRWRAGPRRCAPAAGPC